MPGVYALTINECCSSVDSTMEGCAHCLSGNAEQLTGALRNDGRTRRFCGWRQRKPSYNACDFRWTGSFWPPLPDRTPQFLFSYLAVGKFLRFFGPNPGEVNHETDCDENFFRVADCSGEFAAGTGAGRCERRREPVRAAAYAQLGGRESAEDCVAEVVSGE